MLRPVLGNIDAFPPNRDTLGATAYLVRDIDAQGQPMIVVIDAPPWDEAAAAAIAELPIRWLVITHRGSLGQAARIQRQLGCELVIQEQEAYLLPDTPCTTFSDQFELSPQLRLIWTPGYSPGSSCVYYSGRGGVLFTGRHLLPNQEGLPQPLRFPKTFHWPRQLQQVQRLQQEFTAGTLAYICPGANTGFLRRQRAIADAHAKLQAIDVEAYRQAPVGP